jgi:transcriptional regulator with XRE-family HTH domain
VNNGRCGFYLRNSRTDIPALPFCRTILKSPKPLPITYPKYLKTIGDHLRKSRLDKKLLQIEVGRQLGVNECTIHNWETNLTSPSLAHIPKIIKFIGYIPWKVSAGDIKINRQLLGTSQDALARQIGVDPGTLARWESGERKPSKKQSEKLNQFFISLRERFQ